MKCALKSEKSYLLIVATLLGLSIPAVPAFAKEAAKPTSWFDTLTFSGHLEGGITGNPNQTTGAPNFGSLFTDKANQLLLNQLLVTIKRPIDTTSSNFDFGVTLQGLFGSDARYTHSFNQTDHLLRGRNQLDIVEASVSAHLPVLKGVLENGVDIKAGQFPTPMGAEVIDAAGNYLYSHSYIFNYGIPLKQLGLMATAHVTSAVDLYAGVDTGVNQSLGPNGYNNTMLKGQFGFGLNLFDGKWTVLGFSHIGAENPQNLAGIPNKALRYLNDITSIWKVTPDLTLITELNYIGDDGLGAAGYGAAQYGVYTLNDSVSLVMRGEVWRDNDNVFVASFPYNFDFINSQRGLPATLTTGGKTTYGALTFGVNYKPSISKRLENMVVRPELRVDRALNGTKPFNSGKDKMSFTPAVDVIIPF